MHLNATGVQFEISRGVVARLGWIYRAANVFGNLQPTMHLRNEEGDIFSTPLAL
jgi:hypothetical protein